ncbi:zinc finger protein 41-like [Patiria miniata]|uniref:C2H2-type domain-containing protein n=1 Tax=Patiria miniata TaxID=46514 RepID=A0A914AG07_PATMI|nr:zinc finger protein 41-like [Patiria miniata]XP_038062664.1 zinc finger protein 41-like [Patiria miniata]
MATAGKPALTAEPLLDVSQYEKMGPGGLETKHKILLGAGVLANEAESSSSTSGADPQRHRRKKNRPVQYRPTDNLVVTTQSALTVNPNRDSTEFPATLSSTSSNDRVSPTGPPRQLELEGVKGQESQAILPSGDHPEAPPVNTIGIADVHRTIARQLEQASAIADSEHQPCPFCSYIFSSVGFLVGHLKYRHGINLEMQIGMPTETKEFAHETPHKPATSNSQQEPSTNPLSVLDSCPDESNCMDIQTENGETQIRSSNGDSVNTATHINQSNQTEVNRTGVEGQMIECAKELMLQRMGQLMGPKMNQVAADSQPSQSIIICDMCTRAFTNLDDLQEHQRIHNVAKTYECQFCQKLFQNHSSLKKHTKLHTDGKIYACNYCDKSFAAAAYLKTHLRVHTKQKPFVCKHCGKAFAASGTLISHERIHINDKPYGCEVCGKRFRQGSHLNRHKVIHTNLKPHVCGKCNRAFADVANLRRHERIHSQENPNVCGECGKSFINLSSLKKHERLHTNEKPYICRHCSKPFASSGNLISHERTHTNERPYICKECGKAFTQSSHLKAHMGTHSTDILYVCKDCGRGFTQRSTLCVHERIHLNKRPYVCKVCNRAFTQSGTLKSHIRTHTKEKAHICKVCGRAFSARGNLRSHELIHTNEKPFKCGACPKAFKQGSTLRTHERTHTNEKPYVCHACGKTFADRGNLRSHTLRIHSKSTDLDLGVLQSDDQLTDAVLTQQNPNTEELYPVNEFNDLRTDAGDSSQSPTGIKIKKTVDGLTSMLRFNKEGNIAVDDSVHHKSKVKSTPTDDQTDETLTNVLETASQNEQVANNLDDKMSKSSTIKSDESLNSLRINPRGALYSHLPDSQPHQSFTDSALDLSSGQESLKQAGEAIPDGLNVNKHNIQTFEERTRSQDRGAVHLPQSHHQPEPVGETDQVPTLSDDDFTFDEDDDDDLESLPIASDRNNSDSELLPYEEEHTANTNLQDSCTMEFVVDNRLRNRTSMTKQLVIGRQSHVEDLEISRIIPLN